MTVPRTDGDGTWLLGDLVVHALERRNELIPDAPVIVGRVSHLELWIEVVKEAQIVCV